MQSWRRAGMAWPWSIMAVAFSVALLAACPKPAFAQQPPAMDGMAGMTANGSAEPAGSEDDKARIARLEKRIKELEERITDLRAMAGTFASLKQSGYCRPQGTAGGQPEDMDGNPGLNNHPGQGPAGGEAGGARMAGGAAPAFDADNPGTGGMSGMGGMSGLPEGSMPGTAMAGNEHGANPPSAGGINPAGGENQPESRDDRTLYHDAYSHMLRRDYDSAQRAFASLIHHYPKSRMAGSAQYWLGETYYVRGMYKQAASAFLKSFQNYPNSVKAPDSLLKLAVSLSRLGKKSAACRTFAEMKTKYPSAPSYLLRRTAAESRRAGCN